jgi:hypothetical protein
VTFGKTKNEKIRLSRKVRASMSQYQRMQDASIREAFPDWFEMAADALDTAQVTLHTLIKEHNRERDLRERQAAKARDSS